MLFKMNNSKSLVAFLMVLTLSSCGGGSTKIDLEKQLIAIQKIASYAKNSGDNPIVQDYLDAGVAGVDANNIQSLNEKILSLNYEDVDTKEEIQAILSDLSPKKADTKAPVITLKGDNPASVLKSESYSDAGATALDDTDGSVDVEVSGAVDTTKIATYTLIYTAKDEAGNTASLERIVNVVSEEPSDSDDKIKPEISLVGSAVVNITVGDNYVDEGATANDNKDGNITGKIIAINPVTTSIPDNYKVTYNVDDAAGNHAMEVTRTVVVGQPLRVFGLMGGKDVAEPKAEPENGMSYLYLPKEASSADPVPVVFVAPGFKLKDHTKYQGLLRFIASHGYAVIFAKDDEGFSADHLMDYMKKMVNSPDVNPLLDTSRIGLIGHSSGGGHVFRILKEFSKLSDDKGIKWGEKGRFLLALEPWFAFDMTEDDMKKLPKNTNVVIQQFGVGGNNKENNTDARIPLTEYSLLASISANKKDYQVFVDANHDYPYEVDSNKMQGILKPLDALMEYTFKESPQSNAQKVALEVGNDDPYGSGLQLVLSQYKYGCDGSNTIIDYCSIVRVLPPEVDFTSIATDRSAKKPDVHGKVKDPKFGSIITRVTDRANENGNALLYPKSPTWNSDMSLLRLQYRLYDANTLLESPITSGIGSNSDLYSKNGSMSEMKWSNISPNNYYGITSRYEFVKATISGNDISTEVLATFPSADYDAFTLGKYEGSIDRKDRYVAFAARKKGKRYLTAIIFDIKAKKVIASKNFTEINWEDDAGDQVLDWVSVSPSGQFVLINWRDKPNNVNRNAEASIYQYDINLNYIRTLADQGQHGDIGVDASLKDVWVQFEFGGDDTGIWSYRLSDGKRTRLLPSKYNGGHVSCKNTQRPGWCYLSTTQEGYREVFAVKLDGSGKVNRFVQTRTSDAKNSQGGVSPDGTRIVFDSDWGVDGAVRETYHVKY